MLALIIALLISAGLLFGAFVFIKRSLSGAGDGEKAELIKNLKELDQKLEALASKSKNKASKQQLTAVQEMLTKAQGDLENERANLKIIEEKLGKAQKQVELKEFQQQEIKASKEEDDGKLNDVMAAYADLSKEAIELENRVAQSMKNLDRILSEVTVSDDQKVALQDLGESLTAAGSLLRELITEYQTLNERLKLLKSQHTDLEDEYTRLVEQQLGE